VTGNMMLPFYTSYWDSEYFMIAYMLQRVECLSITWVINC